MPYYTVLCQRFIAADEQDWALRQHHRRDSTQLAVWLLLWGYAAIKTAASKSAACSKTKSNPQAAPREIPNTMTSRAVPTHRLTRLSSYITSDGILRSRGCMRRLVATSQRTYHYGLGAFYFLLHIARNCTVGTNAPGNTRKLARSP